MPTTYRTPGVYVEEISKFPPSVAQVETAIPAFIGYTERAQKINEGDLLFVPTRIKSFMEFELYFGGSPKVEVKRVEIDEKNILSRSEMEKQYLLHDSLRLFFSNGGGACYIISVGQYGDDIEVGDASSGLLGGLAALKKADEPTMILFPDATLLSTRSELYGLQKQALMQCNELGDRFCIFDLLESDPTDSAFDWKAGYEEFRDSIGMLHLKYGAAYAPHLQTTLGATLRYRDIKDHIHRGQGGQVKLENLTKDDEVKERIAHLEEMVAFADEFKKAIDGLKSNNSNTYNSVSEAFQQLKDAFHKDNNTNNFKNIINKLYDIAVALDATVQAYLSSSKMAIEADNLITGVFVPFFTQLVAYEKGTSALSQGSYTRWDADDIKGITAPPWPVAAAIAEDSSIYGEGDDKTKRMNALPYFVDIFAQFNAGLAAFSETTNTLEKEYTEELYESHPVYKNLVDSLKNELSILPPGGAIAGVYAAVDRDRGVWKAPANVSLNGVVGLTVNIDQFDQDLLNVDTTSGKSINAIRAFSGKGIMVWGGRTLAGNDNEWRYISVRRFFNMVEESVKKSTGWAVFEPNDINTWVKVKSMIENYLTILWRQGALQGAKTDQAFFVNVGLGKTMTAIDILEGRMIVEIGMAVVRPAEFIILRFMHKMPES